jgi:hypothetical protein
MNIADFLRERLGEDRRDAACMPTTIEIYAAMQPQAMNGRGMEMALRRISSRERLEREIDAKRAILDEHGGEHMCFENTRDGNSWDYYIGDCRVLRQLAGVYAEHPEYEPEWTP